MTTLYFLGAEVPGWRKALLEEGVEHIGVSYWGTLGGP